MSSTLAETYFLVAKARSKLTKEASRQDHDLRVLVSHANLLDSLMDSLSKQRNELLQRTETKVSFSTPRYVPPVSTISEDNESNTSPFIDDDFEDGEWESDEEDSDYEDESDSETADADAVEFQSAPVQNEKMVRYTLAHNASTPNLINGSGSFAERSRLSPIIKVSSASTEDFEDEGSENSDDERHFYEITNLHRTVSRSNGRSVSFDDDLPQLSYSSEEESEEDIQAPASPTEVSITFDEVVSNAKTSPAFQTIMV